MPVLLGCETIRIDDEGESEMSGKSFGVFVSFLALPALYGCNDSGERPQAVQDDLINTEYPEDVAEIEAVLADIQLAIREGDIDRLISHHAYSPKFSDFQDGGMRTGATENERNEREFFGGASSIEKFEYADPKISVYGDVAVATVHPDVEMTFGDQAIAARRQLTLVFARTEGGWKIVHEHNSPLNPEA